MTRVLIVEDEESYREALAYMLGKEGFDVSRRPTVPRARRLRPGRAPTSCSST